MDSHVMFLFGYTDFTKLLLLFLLLKVKIVAYF